MVENNYQIKFVAIELISKSMSDPPQINVGNIEYNFSFLIDLKLFPPNKIAGVVTDITAIAIKENNEVAHFKTFCVYEIAEFDNIFKKTEENRYDTPMDLEIILKATSLSTTRGIIFSELRGTYLQNAVLPLIDLYSLIKNQREEESKKSAV